MQTHERMQQIIDDLSGEEDRLAEQLAKLKAKQKEIDAELRRVRAAKTELTKTSGNGKSAKPSADKPFVLRTVKEILAAGPLSEQELKQQLYDRADREELSKSGLGRLLSIVLADDALLQGSPESWQLKPTTPLTLGDNQ